LIELEEQKTRFMRQISHELKTPLSAIREGAELLQDGSVGALSQDQLEVSRILRQNALRLQRLIEDLLNYHTVQFQKSGLNLTRVQLAPVLNRVAEAHQLPVRAKDIHLRVECPSIALDADENKLEVILDNLVSNAVKFSPPFGEVAIAARVIGKEVLIDVADQGPGIAPQERDKVFDPFYQGSAKPRGPVKGTGLGLAIVREYVLAHRGRVQIVEDAPEGAHFRISLPMAQAAA
jgi:two-component system, NtrC family, sensor histidine kinase GlrK